MGTHIYGSLTSGAFVFSNEPTLKPYVCGWCKKESKERNTYYINNTHYCCLVCWQRAKKEAFEKEKERQKALMEQMDDFNERKRKSKFAKDYLNLEKTALLNRGFTKKFAVKKSFEPYDDEEEICVCDNYNGAKSVSSKVYQKLDDTLDKNIMFKVYVEVYFYKPNGEFDRALTNVWNFKHSYYCKTRYEKQKRKKYRKSI